MGKNKPAVRQLGRAALFSLVRGACWASGSGFVAAGITWWLQH